MIFHCHRKDCFADFHTLFISWQIFIGFIAVSKFNILVGKNLNASFLLGREFLHKSYPLSLFILYVIVDYNYAKLINYIIVSKIN